MNTSELLNEIFVNSYRISNDKRVLNEEERWTARESIINLLNCLSIGAENQDKYIALHIQIRQELG